MLDSNSTSTAITTIKYRAFIGIGRFSAEDANQLSDRPFQDLKSSCLQKLANKEFKEARKFAVKAVMQYGALGLILYYLERKAFLTHQAEGKGFECIQTRTKTLLTWLSVAKYLVCGIDSEHGLEPESASLIPLYFPEYAQAASSTSIAWSKLESDLNELAHFDNAFVSNIPAKKIFNDCVTEQEQLLSPVPPSNFSPQRQ